MPKWKEPKLTPKELGIDTPLAYLNDSWKIAVDLIDRGRRLYHEGKSLRHDIPDRPGGFPGAWLPVSLGIRSPLVYPWDERDIRHAAKMMNYLWAEEEGLLEEYERNLFIERILENGDFLTHDEEISPYITHVTMFMAAAADMGWCYGITPQVQEKILTNVVKLLERTQAIFDPEKSGFLNVGVGKEWYSRGFWGTFLGEPNHFSANYDGRNKLVIAGMAMAVFTKRYRDAAQEIGAPQAKRLTEIYDHLITAIEGSAWCDAENYYYLQRDDNSARWFLSMNGLCEKSRETDIIPYYAAEACEIQERIKAVARVLDNVILKERVFPMPTRYPIYSWYSPANPNGADLGDDCGQIGGAWDTPYFHCVELLARLGLQKSLQRAVFRRAEVTHRDNDCLESYYLDGAVDDTRYYNRDQYIVSATSHIASLIEGLFGITPAKTGFAEINLQPNLPLYRRYRHSTHPSDWSDRDNRITVQIGSRGRFEMTLHYDEDKETITLKTTAAKIPAHIRLPLDLGSRFKSATWNNKPIEARIEKGMDSDFIYVDHHLDGGILTVQLYPHPQKGKGTTPIINPEKLK